MTACSKESWRQEKVRSVFVDSGWTRRKMNMNVSDLAILPEEHEGDTGRAMKWIFGRIDEPSFNHAHLTRAEDALRLKAHAILHVGVDFEGEE